MKGLSFLQKAVYVVNIPFAFILLISYLSNFINPSIFAWFGIIGLGFPVWVIINLFFVVFWLVSLKKQIFLSVFCLLIGFNHIQSVVKFKSRNKAFSPEESRLRVMSYNIQYFQLFEGNSVAIAKGIRETVLGEDPDILCIQEYFKYKNMPKLNFRYKHIVYTKGDHGLAIYSKQKIINSGKEDFPDENNAYNKIIWADILLSNKDTIRIINTHLRSIGLDQSKLKELRSADLSQEELEKQKKLVIKPLLSAYKVRGHQARILGNFISESPYSVVFCGDLNDPPGSYSYRKVKSQLDDCFVESGKGFATTVPTFHKYKAPLRIDHVMCSPYFTPYNYEVLKKEYSDHFPVVVDLKY